MLASKRARLSRVPIPRPPPGMPSLTRTRVCLVCPRAHTQLNRITPTCRLLCRISLCVCVCVYVYVYVCVCVCGLIGMYAAASHPPSVDLSLPAPPTAPLSSHPHVCVCVFPCLPPSSLPRSPYTSSLSLSLSLSLVGFTGSIPGSGCAGCIQG